MKGAGRKAQTWCAPSNQKHTWCARSKPASTAVDRPYTSTTSLSAILAAAFCRCRQTPRHVDTRTHRHAHA